MNSGDRSTPADLILQANQLARNGDIDGSFRRLRDVIRSHRLAPNEIDRVGRLLSKWTLTESSVPRVRALMLGQCTTGPLATSLRAIAWGDSVELRVHNAEYDNVIQELMSPTNIDSNPDIIVLVPWMRQMKWDGLAETAEQWVANEVSFWQHAWAIIETHYSAKLIQVGFDWIISGPQGSHLSSRRNGEIDVIRRANDSLRKELPNGAFFVDLEQVSGAIGRSTFYDARSYFWTKQPFSEAGVVELAKHLSSAVRAVSFGPKKVLVLDLDNTLWGGVVGEAGPLGIALGATPDGEAFQAFQSYTKSLSKRGVLLAIASKNNHEDAVAPFLQNKEMVLAIEDIAHFETHWEPKVSSLRRIADALCLGLDTLVFFDDNPAERELIRQTLPEVEVVDVPDDPAEYVRALEAGLWFEAVTVLKEDLQRTQQYQQEQKRRSLHSQLRSVEDYLRTLEMRAVCDIIKDDNIQRVVQLLGKTNQFNLTTRRLSETDVRRLINTPGCIAIVLNLSDRFGDYGLVSALIAIPDRRYGNGAMRIDTWLMSCRVIGRTVEEFLYNRFIEISRNHGWDTVIGEFVPTRKNAVVADLYLRFGFEQFPEEQQNSVQYHIELRSARELPSAVIISGSSHE